MLGASDAVELTQLLLVGSDLGVNASHIVGMGDVVLEMRSLDALARFLI